MASEVEVVISGKDNTGAAAASAKENLKKVKDETDKIGDSAKKSSKDVDGLGDSFKGVGEAAAGFVAADFVEEIGNAARQFISGTITQAKNLGESINAVNVTFGDSAEKIHEWGEQNARSFGISRQSFNSQVMPIAAMLKNVGFSMDEVADQSITLTKRAADMASVFNVEVSEALDAIQAALRGESDPIERFGVSVNAAAVESRALAMASKASADELTNQELMAARLAIVMEQTAQVQGDFAATSDQAANAQRIATATFQEAQAALGEAFLPALTLLAQGATKVLEGFLALPGPVQEVISIVTILGAGALIAAPKVIALTTAIQGFTSAAGGKKAILSSLAGFMTGPWGIAIAAGVAVMEIFTHRTEDAKLETEGLRESLDQVTGAVTDNTREWVANKLQQEGALDNALDLGLSLETVTEAALGNAAAMAAVNKALDEQGGSAEAAAAAYGEGFDQLSALEQEQVIAAYSGGNLIEIINGISEQLGIEQDAIGQVTDATGAQTDATKEAIAAIEEETAARQAQIDLLRAQVDPIFAVIQAQERFEEAQRKSNEAIEEYGADSEEAQAASVDLAEAALDLRDASGRLSSTFDGSLDPAMRDVLKAAGMTEDQIDDVEDAFRDAAAAGEDFEGTYKATLKLETVGQWNVPSSGILPQQAHGGNVGGLGALGHAAEGGPRGAFTVVGEEGPEIVRLPFGSNVMPAGASRRALGREPGGNMQGRERIELIIMPRPGMERTLTDAILQVLSFRIRTEGGDVQDTIGRSFV